MEELLRTDQFKNAWNQVSFGPHPPKNIIGRNLLSIAMGYNIGSGAHFLLTECGLIEGDELTDKGRSVLYEPFKNKELKSGIDFITQERNEQIEKHGYTIEDDVKINHSHQLNSAASYLIVPDKEEIHIEDAKEFCPSGWDSSLWAKMMNKSYYERLVIAGSLIAAEIDRISYKN